MINTLLADIIVPTSDAVGQGKVKPEEAKVSAIHSFLQPQGCAIISRSCRILSPIHSRFRDDRLTPHRFNQERYPRQGTSSPTGICPADQKSSLTSESVLASPNFNRSFLVQTDASNVGVGAVLSQDDATGHDKPVAYYSRKLLPRETRYSTKEKECLAVVEGIQHLSIYLTGTHFTVHTDHKCLQWMKDMNGRLTRWSLLLQPYDFTVVHRAGTMQQCKR